MRNLILVLLFGEQKQSLSEQNYLNGSRVHAQFVENQKFLSSFSCREDFTGLSEEQGKQTWTTEWSEIAAGNSSDSQGKKASREIKGRAPI